MDEKFIKGWSWGAFFLGFIWAFGSRLYGWGVALIFIPFVPIANVVFWIYFSVVGRKKSWEKGKWASFDEFKERQVLLDKIGFVLFLVGVLIAVLQMVRFYLLMK